MEVVSKEHCTNCNLYEPHHDLARPEEIERLVTEGDIVREPDTCSKWLGADGACPHDEGVRQ